MPEIFGAALMGGGSGQAFAAIGVIYPAGATCTCSYGGKTLTSKDTSGRALFLVPTVGQWLVKATNQAQEAEDTVSITTKGQVASVTLAFFTATIETTFPTDCTSVTCKKDAVTLSVPSGSLSSGEYTFNIPEVGEWVLYATNGTKEKAITVSVTEERAYTAALRFETYYYNLGDQCTDVTGGWVSFDGYATVENESNRLAVASNNDSPDYPNTGGTSKKIDLTGISTLYFDGYCANSSSNNQYGLISTKSNGSFTAYVKPNTSRGMVSLDVSQYSGMYFIAIKSAVISSPVYLYSCYGE